MANELRDRVRLQVDGQLKTGRDIVTAALLGAEEFGFGTTLLVSLGCVMMRKCHLNTCPVGIATQDPELRSRFTGKPEYVERFLRFIAEEVREIMAELGFRTMDEMVGHAEVLDAQPPAASGKLARIDLSPVLYQPRGGKDVSLHCIRQQSPIEETDLDRKLMEQVQPAIKKGTPVTLEMKIRNVHRSVGTRISGEIAREFGAKGLPENTVKLHFKGSAGQSLGAFLAPGITIRVEGDANDYLGKGMSGGRIILVPPADADFAPHENVIVGNTVLYGATGGEVFINGIAGERFAVRNSGACAVVEGVGNHGCEYMTGGVVVVIGHTGNNFAAGMSGGIAYVYDNTALFDTKCNLSMVELESVWDKEDRTFLRSLVEKHYRFTKSPLAEKLLKNWEAHLPLFVKVTPVDYRQALERMRLKEDTDKTIVSATEEVYNG